MGRGLAWLHNILKGLWQDFVLYYIFFNKDNRVGEREIEKNLLTLKEVLV